jgi:hypothetical protein
MSRRWTLFAVVAAILFLGAVVPAWAQPDLTLYTYYTIDTAHTNVTWIVCGSTQQSSGCYAAGVLGPFKKVGAILQGNAGVNKTTNTVTRLIYVLDVATGANSDGVTLYVYKKTDMVTPSFDTVAVSLNKTVPLPLTGGNTALSSMAANGKFVFIGTDQTPNVVRLQKSNYAIVTVGGFSPPINVTAITSDKYGYITVAFGNFGGDAGNFVFGPDGLTRGDGGGAFFMLNTDQAVLPSNLP